MTGSNQQSKYFSDHCPKTVFGNEIATPCSLKLGHDGPCKPTPLGKQTVANQHSVRRPMRRHHETSDEMLLRFARDVRDLAHEMQLDPSRPSGERTVAALFLEFLNARERKQR